MGYDRSTNVFEATIDLLTCVRVKTNFIFSRVFQDIFQAFFLKDIKFPMQNYQIRKSEVKDVGFGRLIREWKKESTRIVRVVVKHEV